LTVKLKIARAFSAVMMMMMFYIFIKYMTIDNYPFALIAIGLCVLNGDQVRRMTLLLNKARRLQNA
jgi:hypothetical protein